MDFYSLTGAVVALILAALLLSFATVIVGWFVKLLLNEKAWGTQLFDHWVVLAKVLDILTYANCKTLQVGAKVKGYAGDGIERVFVLRKRDDYYYFESGLYEWGVGFKERLMTCVRSKGFKTLGEATKTIEDKGFEVVENPEPFISFFVVHLICAVAALDLLQLWFIYHPSTAFIGIPLITTMLSVRWLSGMLASVAKRTVKSEERLDKLEAKHNEEQK